MLVVAEGARNLRSKAADLVCLFGQAMVRYQPVVTHEDAQRTPIKLVVSNAWDAV